MIGAGSDIDWPGGNHITANHFLRLRSETSGLWVLSATDGLYSIPTYFRYLLCNLLLLLMLAVAYCVPRYGGGGISSCDAHGWPLTK